MLPANTPFFTLSTESAIAKLLGELNDALELKEDRHGSRSTLITSQVRVQAWHDAIGDPTLADAIIDRLLHIAHRVKLKGKFMRPTRSTIRQQK